MSVLPTSPGSQLQREAVKRGAWPYRLSSRLSPQETEAGPHSCTVFPPSSPYSSCKSPLAFPPSSFNRRVDSLQLKMGSALNSFLGFHCGSQQFCPFSETSPLQYK